jgi:hypothetical protein
MEVVGLASALLGTLAGVAGAYFAWASLNRARRGGKAFAPSNPGTRYDVFISYAHADEADVTRLAKALHRCGVRVALDKMFMGPAKIIVHEVDTAIRDSVHGLVVFSPDALASAWVRNEYAALMRRSIEMDRLFVPVLIRDTRVDDLPELARTRYFTDLRDASSAVYGRQVKELAVVLGGNP